MILLSEIDHHRVLDGARVPLCWHITDEQIAAAEHPTDRRLLEDTRNARIEWCGDIGWRNEGTGYGTRFFHEPWGAMAIDPAHPDVARVLDRRIAEARGFTDVHTATLLALHEKFQIVATYEAMGTICCEFASGFDVFDSIANIEPTTANIPAARAALIRALYPKETP